MVHKETGYGVLLLALVRSGGFDFQLQPPVQLSARSRMWDPTRDPLDQVPLCLFLLVSRIGVFIVRVLHCLETHCHSRYSPC